ncbi:MAG: hypothetical protein GX129_00185 [Clostridiales bacterium]|jgi:hypothetical protein|nr:hypothetical protein [Clostridiales bacterium]
MRFRRKLKRTTKQYIIVALICILVIGSAAIITSIISIGQVREEYEYILSEAKKEMNDNKKSVFIALSDIRTGEILSKDKVEEKIVYSSQPIESYISKDELGKAVMIDIPEGTHIVKGMLAENLVSSILREIEYDVIHISSNIVANDYVDVRIFFPNGENYIVLSKKSLKGYQPGTPLCYMWVDEEEILRMSAAIVDAALYQGSKLLVTKYIEPNIQDASIITYVPNISVLSLIEHDPNIVERCSQLLNKEVRMALENRLAESMGMDVSSIRWNLDDIDIRYMPIYNIAYEQIDEIEEKAEGIFEEKGLEIIDDKVDEIIVEKIQEEIEDKIKENTEGNEASTYFPELGNKDRSDTENYFFATEG